MRDIILYGAQLYLRPRQRAQNTFKYTQPLFVGTCDKLPAAAMHDGNGKESVPPALRKDVQKQQKERRGKARPRSRGARGGDHTAGDTRGIGVSHHPAAVPEP